MENLASFLNCKPLTDVKRNVKEQVSAKSSASFWSGWGRSRLDLLIW